MGQLLFVQKGFYSLLSSLFILLSGIQFFKYLPFFSLTLGFIGTYLISLAIENEVREHLEDRFMTRDSEIRRLFAEWPSTQRALILKRRPTWWQALRPYIVADLLWRNTQVVPSLVRR